MPTLQGLVKPFGKLASYLRERLALDRTWRIVTNLLLTGLLIGACSRFTSFSEQVRSLANRATNVSVSPNKVEAPPIARPSARIVRLRIPPCQADDVGCYIEATSSISEWGGHTATAILLSSLAIFSIGIVLSHDSKRVVRRLRGKRLTMTFSISSDETCAVSAVYENIKTHDGTPLRLPLRCNYLLAPKDGSVVKMTDLTVSSRPDASAHLQPAFLAIAPVYDGAIEFQTKTPGPVEVHLGYTVRNNFCLDAARFRKRWGLSANEEAIDDYKWVVTTDWKEITWEFHWPATFAATGPLWLMWLPPGASNDAPPGALPHKHFELTQEARKWVLRLKGVPVGAAIMPRWKLDEPPTKFA